MKKLLTFGCKREFTLKLKKIQINKLTLKQLKT